MAGSQRVAGRRTEERRLAAIMFTDIVGYTSLAQRNEMIALRLLQQHRAALRACLREYNGREVKTMGDGFLVEFASALEAVNCALSIRQSCEEMNVTLPQDERVPVRIGIHVGDVIHSEGDVHGDAVNVASRIEPLAGPGEICVTQQVYDNVRNKLDFQIDYMGKHALKNVDLPVDVYKVGPKSGKSLLLSKPVETADRHRLVVLPLANISPDASDEYLADGLTEELISVVSKVSGLKVISRTSAMKYKGTTKNVGEIAGELNVGVVLEGSIRKAGNKLRITVQLVDVQKDEHLWSQSYDRELSDVFAIQSDIASRVAEALEVHLLHGDKKRLEKKATQNIEAYTLYLKGLHYRGEGTEGGYKKAIRYFEEALRKDPKFALAYAGLAGCYAQMGEEGMLPPKVSYRKGKQYATKALELDDEIPEAHATLGAILEEYYFDQEGAEREFRKALGLNPNYGQVCRSYGAHLACMGKLDQAISEIERAQELNPLSMDVNSCAAVIFNCANQYDRALVTCRMMLKIDENFFPAYQHLAETYLHMSMFDEAILALQKALEISPGASTVRGRLGYACALSGRRSEAKKILRELTAESKRKYVLPVAIALVHCGLGDKKRAMDWLERAYREHAGAYLLSLKVRPIWASLREEPRFKSLLRKMGLL